MPDFPRTATAAEVWSYGTRTLTGFTGQPRTDLLGEDADFESGTGTRKARIDRLANMESQQTPEEGTASFAASDTYPKTVTIIDTSGKAYAGKQHVVEGYIDLSELADGESIKVTYYVSIVDPVDYKKYAEETYSDAQSLPMLFLTTKPARYGIKIELTMDSAPSADRSFKYQLFQKVIE